MVLYDCVLLVSFGVLCSCVSCFLWFGDFVVCVCCFVWWFFCFLAFV